ncbi:MAG: hypothetical protein AB1730_25265 [Myxococcota bacterium]|jgi:hypothetical protein
MHRLLLLSTLTLASLSFAEPPAEVAKAQALIEKDFLKPLAAKEEQRSSFSRARLPPQERRVRITDDAPKQDAQGGAFYTFAIDARHGVDWMDEGEKNPWLEATITGCVYPATGAIFVKSGAQHRPAAFMLGKKVKPAEAQVCTEAKPTQVAGVR